MPAAYQLQQRLEFRPGENAFEGISSRADDGQIGERVPAASAEG